MRFILVLNKFGFNVALLRNALHESTIYATALLSVHPPVCLSHSWSVSKWLSWWRQ